MQFSTIFALSLAAVASASPVLEVRTTGAEAANSCSNVNNAKVANCCKFTTQSVLTTVLGLLQIQQISLPNLASCGGVNVASTTACSNNQKVFCCNANGPTSQTGLVNIAAPGALQCVGVA